MGSSKKKVIVRTSLAGDQAVQAGYLAQSRVLDRRTGTIELLDTAGRIVPVALKAVRYVAYVRDFNLTDTENPERLQRKTFLARPRTEGLWVRVTFHDGEVLEGLAPLDVSLVEDAMADEGIYLIPPDVRSNTQRIFVPRLAMAEMVVLGVITTPSKTIAPPAKAKRHEGELDLPFPEPR